jgi:lipopolysaccharide heptosyltransferase II
MPYFDEIRYFDAPWMVKNRRKILHNLGKTVRNLRKEKYEMAIDLRGDFRHNILMFLSNIRYRLGFNIAGCDFLLTHVIPCSPNHHNVKLCFDLIKYLKLKESEKYKPFINITDHDRDKAATIIKQFNTGKQEKKGPLIVIHPGASWYGRRWKPERFAQIANRLIAEYNARVILAGSHFDREITDKIADNMNQRVVIAAGKTTVRELAGLLSMSNVYLGLDSGPTHMASATNTKIVALFGPANPDSVGPWGEGHIIISHHKEFPCSPCDQTVCQKIGNSCMDAIHINEVFNAVSQQIKKSLQAN